MTADRKTSLSDIRTAAESCQLCEMILRALQLNPNNDDLNVNIVREGAALHIRQGGTRILRFCASPG
jgi:hypothetical protein